MAQLDIDPGLNPLIVTLTVKSASITYSHLIVGQESSAQIMAPFDSIHSCKSTRE